MKKGNPIIGGIVLILAFFIYISGIFFREVEWFGIQGGATITLTLAIFCVIGFWIIIQVPERDALGQYTEPPKLVKSFGEVKYVCGYGIIIKKNKKKVLDILNNANWRKLSNLTSHNAKHISMEHIRKALIMNGLVDNKRIETQTSLNDRPNSVIN